MSKCPFWSNKKEKVNCYNECPMYPKTSKYDECPFKEYLNDSNIVVKEEIDNRFDDYSNDNLYELVGTLVKH